MRAAAVLDFYEFDVRSMMQLGQQKHQRYFKVEILLRATGTPRRELSRRSAGHQMACRCITQQQPACILFVCDTSVNNLGPPM